MAMIATTMRSSIRVKILVFTLETRTEEQGTLKYEGAGKHENEERRNKAEWGSNTAGMKLLFHKSSL